MEFSKIKIHGNEVELVYSEQQSEQTRADVVVHGENPTPAFRTALGAFTSYVVWIHSWSQDAAERVEIRGVSIKRPEDDPRGIVVTGLLKCPRARSPTSTFNTPFLDEAPSEYSGDFAGFLPKHVVDFVDALEAEATRYIVDGERGEQTELALGEPGTPPQTSDEKPKRKGRDFVPGVGDVVNADASEPVTDDVLRQLLLSVGRDVPIDAIARWTSTERDGAARWATITQKQLIGQLKGDAPDEPTCVQRDATLPLQAVEE